MMELSYLCRLCGQTSRIPMSALISAGAIICPKCGRTPQGKTADELAAEKTKKTEGDFIRQTEEESHFESAENCGTAEENYLASLNPEQHAAACFDGKERGILVMAGAGCGKTRTMIARAIYLLQCKYTEPRRIAMLTFTRRAAREVQERLERERPGVSQEVFVGTFHRFCLNILHRYRSYFQEEVKGILDRDDQTALLRRIRGGLKSKEEGGVKALEGLLPKEGEIASTFSYANNCRLSLEEYFEKYPAERPETLPLMLEVQKQYREYKQSKGMLDFDDILSVVAGKLADSPELCRKIRNRLDEIMVDEMQDTSPVQWEILKCLYAPPLRLFCVGDDAQSIYSFRGADFQSIHHFCSALSDSVILRLTENYRSSQSILDLANAILSGSPLDYQKKLRAHSGIQGDKPALWSFYSEGAEAEVVSLAIQKALNLGVSPSEIQVLLRTANSGRFLEAEMRKRRIPYRMIGGTSFLQAAHVKDLVSSLEAVVSPQNEIASLRMLTLFKGVGTVGAEKMIAAIRGAQTPEEARALLAAQVSRKSAAASEFLRGVVTEEQTPSACLNQILKFFDDSEVLAHRYENWQERRHDLDAVVGISEKYNTVEEFLEAFKLDPDAEKREQDEARSRDKSKVTLITVHSAKGTEADFCFVLRFQQGTYPHYRSMESMEEIEEERRILYVAVTRARKGLVLTQCDMNWTPKEDSLFHTPEVDRLLSRPKKKRASFGGERASRYGQGESWGRRVNIRPAAPPRPEGDSGENHYEPLDDC